MTNDQRNQQINSLPRLSSTLILLLVFLPLLLAPAAASAAGPGAQGGPGSPSVELQSPEELETYFDGAVAAQLEAYPVAGMTVSVVKDGELLFAKGYGYADVEAQVPVAAGETLFRVASLSKPFVWTAMMQLVEAGRLDLDADVNRYLDFQIPKAYYGRYGDTRILQEESARQMQEVAFAQDPRVGGWGVGFAVAEMDGLRVVSHNGVTNFFNSQLMLLPQENVGLFISSNTHRGIFARSHLMHAFLERYFVDGALDRPGPPPAFGQRAQRYTGTYYPARMNFSGIGKLRALTQPVQVQATGEGGLAVSGLPATAPTDWVERSPNLFAPASENLPPSAELVFQPEEGTEEQIEYLLFRRGVYIKQPAHASQGFHFTLVGISALFFLAVLLAVPAGALVHRRYRQAAPAAIGPHPAGARLARWLAWLFALLNLVFLIVLFRTLSDLTTVVFGLPAYLEALLVVPWLAAGLFIALGAFAGLAWIRRYWTLWGRIFYTLFILVAAGYLWFLWFWNLL